MLDIPLLKKICEIPGAPGFENRIRDFIKTELLHIVDDMYVDAMGNLIAVRKSKSKKKVMVAAHLDEISFIVTGIDDNGFIRLHTLGGFDPKTLTAQRVIVHGKKDIIGVMGCKPIHIMDAAERSKVVKIKEYFIDTGLSAKEVKRFVSVGDPITRERELIEMGNCVNSKSIDNRVSVYILLEVLKKLEGKSVPYDLYACFTVQEEVGLRGAIAAASGINPDFAINLDTTIAYDLPGAAPHEMVTKLGDGAAIKVMDNMTICDQRMVNFLKQIATTKKINHQIEVLTMGGTDTAGMQRHAKGGSIAGGISIPTRYIHQVIEMANKSDIDDSIFLLYHALRNMGSYNWSF